MHATCHHFFLFVLVFMRCKNNLVLFQEDAYKMLLYIFIGSLLPWIQGLDSWLFEGILDDPFEEVLCAPFLITVHIKNFLR